jgi:hypothetical protein
LKLRFWLALVLGALGAVPAAAHHSLAIYNRFSSETVVGTVESFNWSNPHVRLVLMSATPDGVVTQWTFEGGSINRLASAGFNRNMIATGDKVTVTYNPRRDGTKSGLLVTIVAPGGRKYDARRNRGPSRGGAEEG